MKNSEDPDQPADQDLYKGSYMDAHVLMILSNELVKRDKMQGLPSILPLFAARLINSIIQEHEC